MSIAENAYFETLDTRQTGAWQWPKDTWLQIRLAETKLEEKLEKIKED